MSPEILRGNPYTKASDIYSLGIIINEIISVIPPFNNQPHGHFLALDICQGLRPEIREETPEFLKKLIKKCWDANPENRPSSNEIITSLNDFIYTKDGDNIYTKLYQELIKASYNFIDESAIAKLFETHPQAIYTSRLLDFPNLPEPVNCQNQEGFISSRSIIRVQSGEINAFQPDECYECAINELKK